MPAMAVSFHFQFCAIDKSRPTGIRCFSGTLNHPCPECLMAPKPFCHSVLLVISLHFFSRHDSFKTTDARPPGSPSPASTHPPTSPPSPHAMPQCLSVGPDLSLPGAGAVSPAQPGPGPPGAIHAGAAGRHGERGAPQRRAARERELVVCGCCKNNYFFLAGSNTGDGRISLRCRSHCQQR